MKPSNFDKTYSQNKSSYFLSGFYQKFNIHATNRYLHPNIPQNEKIEREITMSFKNC